MRKMKRLASVMMCFVTVMVWLTGCNTSKNVNLTLTINGSEFTFKSKVQDLYDAGLVLCDTGYGKIIPDDELPDLEARTVDTITGYYIGIPSSSDSSMADYTGVKIHVYNPSGKDCSFKDASIFYYEYSMGSQGNPNIEVLFNNVNFAGMKHDEGVAAMEGMGITFEKEDKEEFLDETTNKGYGWHLRTRSSGYHYSIERERADDGSLYTSQVYFEKALDIDYSK